MRLNPLEVLGIVGPLASLFGLAYGIYSRKRSERKKELAYDLLAPLPIAQVMPAQGEYTLRVVYEQPGQEPVYIDRAFLHYLRFANFGRTPIRKEDLASGDPLRITFSRGKVLEVSLVGVTREVCQIAVSRVDREDGIASAHLAFEFLDYLDGALVRVVTDNKNTEIALRGTIIGMPEGIIRFKEAPTSWQMPPWGCILAMLLEVLAFASLPFAYRHITGSWSFVWVLALPLIPPLFLVLVIVLVSMFATTPRGRLEFPLPLRAPRWYRRALSFHERPIPEEAMLVEPERESSE